MLNCKDSRTLHLIVRVLLVGCLLFQNIEEMTGYSSPVYGISEEPAGLHFSLSTTNQTTLYEEESAEDRIQRAVGALVCTAICEPEGTDTKALTNNSRVKKSWQLARYDLFLQNRRLLI